MSVRGDELERIGVRARGNPRKSRRDARGLRRHDLELFIAIPFAEHSSESRAHPTGSVVDHGVGASEAVFRVASGDGESNYRDGHADTRCGSCAAIDAPAVPSIAISGGCANVAWIVHNFATRRAASSLGAGSDGQLKRLSYRLTRCGFCAKVQDTSKVRSPASSPAFSAQAYMTEKVQYAKPLATM